MCAGSHLGSGWQHGGSWDLTPFEATSLTPLNSKYVHCGSASPQKGYDDLQAIVPTCEQQDFSIGCQKLSKAIVLQKSES